MTNDNTTDTKTSGRGALGVAGQWFNVGRALLYKIVLMLATLAMAVELAGCAMNRLDLPQFSPGARSNLSRKNFRVVQNNARGVSHGFALLGLVPIASPSMSNAMHDLHQRIQAEGKAIALVNVAQDRSTTYLFLFSVPTLTVSADAIEFLDEPTGAISPPPPAPVAAPPAQAAPPAETSRTVAAPQPAAAAQETHAADRPRIEIVDLEETPSANKKRVTLTGTLVNRGARGTSAVSVKVNALADDGKVLISVPAVPDTNTIPPNGGTTSFSATLDDQPAVKRYHVEALTM